VQTEAPNAQRRPGATGNTTDFATDDITAAYNLAAGGVDPQQTVLPAQNASQSSYGNSQNAQGIYLHPTM
jgi:hypothetical protein